eukprot:7154774-Alexandrium_andersonii.AAC.1
MIGPLPHPLPGRAMANAKETRHGHHSKRTTTWNFNSAHNGGNSTNALTLHWLRKVKWHMHKERAMVTTRKDNDTTCEEPQRIASWMLPKVH